MANQGPAQTKRERQRERAEAKRAAERKAQQRRTLGYTLAGIALIALVVVLVVALMDDGGSEDNGGSSAAGEVTVDGAPRDTALAPGDAVPAFTAPDLFGGTVTWDDYASAPAVVSVWAPWCPHCQSELPVVDGVMVDYPEVGWLTIVTAIDAQPGPTPEEYMTDNDLSFPVAVDDDQGTLASAFGIEVFPTLYFVNSDGTVGVTLTGEVDEATLRSTIESLA